MPEAVPLVVSVAAVAWAYQRGLGRRRASVAGAGAGAASGPATSRWQAAFFFAGLGTLLSVLATPFDHLAGERLWAHMVQHVVLIAVAAPLVVLGNPLATLLSALPHRAQLKLSPLLRRLSHGAGSHYAALAVLALGAHTAALWAWHVPGPYEAALRSEGLHVVEHASLFATALLLWWAVVGSRRGARYGLAILVTFAAALQGSALGALMTLATTPWYDPYVRAATRPGAGSGLTPIEDQQVAGVVMWGPCGLIYVLAAVLLFAAWIRPSVGGSRTAHAF